MKTTIIAHTQGSAGWHTHRASHFNASDCAAMLGQSSYKTRSQLLHEKATGLTPEVDAQTQARFDRGHEYEAIARPWAEEIIGSELYPVVLAGEVDGLKLSASLDGLTMTEDVSFEHKTLNAALEAALADGIIPDEYHAQLEMGLMLSGAERCLFVASSGDKDAMRYAWYMPNYAFRQRILDGWKQFAADLADYKPVPVEIKHTGHAPETLPALHIEVTGMVTASNLADFKAHALAVFAGINRELVTDAQFADAEKTVKWCADIERRLDAAKQHALSQTASIDELFRTMDDIGTEARAVRLGLDRLVKARKDAIRAEIVTDGRNALGDHISALVERIGHGIVPTVAVDFAGVIKGKRTLDSMRDAVATELARAKIEANAIADRVTINLRLINEKPELAFLFADVVQLVFKAPDDLAAVMQNRITIHQAKEAARIEADRQRIAAEERTKAEAAAQARIAADVAAATAKAREQAYAQASADAAAKRASDEAIAKAQAANQPITPVSIAHTATEPVAYKHDDSHPASPPALRLGQICARLGFTVSADFLDSLGFAPAATDKNAKLYHENDFPRMCQVLARHVLQAGRVAVEQEVAA